MEYPVNGGRADIVLFLKKDKSFVVIETKKKSHRVPHAIDPLNYSVIQQALGYAQLLGAPYIVTANAEYLACFAVPPGGEKFSIERHRVYLTQISKLNRDFTRKFLESVIQYHQASIFEKARLRTGLDWTFIIRLRSFVSWLTKVVEPTIIERLRSDSHFQVRIREFEKEKTIRLGPRALARQMSYILMNRILFYKILERNYLKLPHLQPINAASATSYLQTLSGFFSQAMLVTKDFEAVFRADIYDEISLPEESDSFIDTQDNINQFILDMDTYKIEDIGADVIGYVYEELIPGEERHAMGQFYTPPAIAELISKWAIRSSDDIILEPAAGSGTFLIKSYSVLRRLKIASGETDSKSLHFDTLKQLYAVDINPFPVHLTAVNLSMRDVKHPFTEMNIIQEDFFKIKPEQMVFAPYSIQTPDGETRRNFRVPYVDAVIANPPYTRWTELSESSRSAVSASIGPLLSEYGMRPGSVRSEPMIYTHFVMHGLDFLKTNDNKSARLAMIISNSWLQADYGIKFGKFILSNFKVVGIVDFSARVFNVPLVATLVILLERAG